MTNQDKTYTGEDDTTATGVNALAVAKMAAAARNSFAMMDMMDDSGCGVER